MGTNSKLDKAICLRIVSTLHQIVIIPSLAYNVVIEDFLQDFAIPKVFLSFVLRVSLLLLLLLLRSR